MKRIVSWLLAFGMLCTFCTQTPKAMAEENESVSEINRYMTPDEARKRDIPAFVGAEGGGKYATGGRGCEVYTVTNLNDSGEGSLRDAVSKPNRMVVFAVSGNIDLKSPLVMKQPNITVAGQTSPGGICLANYHLQVDADNLIIRYLRFRPGDISKEENDAVWGRYKKDIIVDHCSSSWSTDETISIYAVANATVQWCIGSESLTLAAHAKGRHGYGGIWGGSNVTYHHNLIANHTSRLPRYASKTSCHPDFADNDGNDMVNNVIYNWGFNNSYGAEDATVNVINNYYKAGPITIDETVGERIFNPSNGGKFYFGGNVLEGSDKVTADNLKGVHPQEGKEEPEYLSEPCYDFLTPLDNPETAEEAYESVLKGAGATIPRRDAYDAKIVNDVRNGTGRAINNESEVGGWQDLSSDKTVTDTDGDGIPDEWESMNKLDSNNPEDGRILTETGYTPLEIYLEELVRSADAPNNPEVTLNIKNNSLYTFGDSIELTSAAKAADGRTVTKVEYYDGDVKIGEGSGENYALSWNGASEGVHYVMAKAVDSETESTISEVKVINVNYDTDTAPWIGVDIGETDISGSSAFVDGKYIVKSAGLIGPDFETNSGSEYDAFRFMYQKADTYSEISTQITEVSKLNNNCVTGIMIRDELTPESDFALINYEFEKGGPGLSFRTRSNGVYNKEFIRLEEIPRYVKLYKDGAEVKSYHSENGIDWTFFSEVKIKFEGENYAGIAVDGNKEKNDIYNYTRGVFSDLKLNNYGEERPQDVEIGIEKNMFTSDEIIKIDVNCLNEDEISKVELYIDGKLKAEEVDKPFKFEVSVLDCGSHFITAVAADKNGGESGNTINIGVSKLDSGWKIVNIGDTSAMSGAVSMNGSDITMYGCGFGVDEAGEEEFPYVYKKVSGDSKISFKVDEQTLIDYEQIGIAVRKSLDDAAESYAGYFQIYNGEFFKKSVKGDEVYEKIAQEKYKKAPVYISLEKTGNKLKFMYSENGSEWIDVGEEEINLDEYYIGIFAASAEENACIPFKLSEFSAEFSDSGFKFSDLEGFEWAENDIYSLYERGIISGNGDGTFAPQSNVTRAEFTKMMVKALGYEGVSENSQNRFNDVGTLDWFYDAVRTAEQYALIGGRSDTEFAPNEPVTREEMIVMIYRGIIMSDKRETLREIPQPADFKDADTVSSWAADAVNKLAMVKIINGDENGMLMPKNNASRAEAAKILAEFLKAME